MENLLNLIFQHHPVWLKRRAAWQRSLWVVEHTCTKTHTTIVALEDVVVATTLATLPDLFVIGQFREGYGFVTEARVEFHDRQRSCDTEYFCKRESFSCQFKGLCLDLSECALNIVECSSAARTGDIFSM